MRNVNKCVRWPELNVSFGRRAAHSYSVDNISVQIHAMLSTVYRLATDAIAAVAVR